MRRQILALAPALLFLGACSQGAQDDVDNSLARTGDSLANAADDASARIDNATRGIGRDLDRATDDAGRRIDNAAEDFGDRADRIGNAIERETR